MILNPNGKKKEDGNSHIPILFLAMTDPDDVSLDWEVNVVASSLCSMEFATDIWLFKVLDYDQVCDCICFSIPIYVTNVCIQMMIG
jgi:hypothetical protein